MERLKNNAGTAHKEHNRTFTPKQAVKPFPRGTAELTLLQGLKMRELCQNTSMPAGALANAVPQPAKSDLAPRSAQVPGEAPSPLCHRTELAASSVIIRAGACKTERVTQGAVLCAAADNGTTQSFIITQLL